MEDKNINIVKELYKFFRERDDDNISVLLSHDIKWNQMEGFPRGKRIVGINEVIEDVFQRLRFQWDNWESFPEYFYASGNIVFVKGHYSGTHRLSKKSFNVPFIGEYRIEGDRITEFNQFTDTFLIVQATIG